MSDDAPTSGLLDNGFGVASLACGIVSWFVATLILAFLAICFGTNGMHRASVNGTSKPVPMTGFFVGVLTLVTFALLNSGLVRT